MSEFAIIGQKWASHKKPISRRLTGKTSSDGLSRNESTVWWWSSSVAERPQLFIGADNTRRFHGPGLPIKVTWSLSGSISFPAALFFHLLHFLCLRSAWPGPTSRHNPLKISNVWLLPARTIQRPKRKPGSWGYQKIQKMKTGADEIVPIRPRTKVVAIEPHPKTAMMLPA